MRFLSDRRLLLVSRLVLGIVFIYASYDKALNPLAFAQIIHNYRIMPPSLINISAIILPWIELLAGVLIIVGLRVRGANLILGGLLVFYIALLSVTAIRGININCGCFSTSASVRTNLVVDTIRDVVFLIFALHILLFYRPPKRSRAIG
ncbi:MAG: hypothetical protein A2W25_14450 [candidate division Zixibacteria bacterium RBG_16_53_22]|nr:MAG: hypothetical protein A2W25_14450 [candidate division Zixibacteria bacterium RBG_16_53_22]